MGSALHSAYTHAWRPRLPQCRRPATLIIQAVGPHNRPGQLTTNGTEIRLQSALNRHLCACATAEWQLYARAAT